MPIPSTKLAEIMTQAEKGHPISAEDALLLLDEIRDLGAPGVTVTGGYGAGGITDRSGFSVSDGRGAGSMNYAVIGAGGCGGDVFIGEAIAEFRRRINPPSR